MEDPDKLVARRKARRVRCAVVALVLLLVGLSPGCNGLFYHPDNHAYRNRNSFPGSEDVVFASRDGTKLHAWFLPAIGKSKGTVVYFHGNAQNLTSHISFVDWLPASGFDVFAFDYRGYGRSEGCVSRQGIYEDSVAALDYVRSRPDVDAQRIVVFGQSLGGACAAAALGGGEAGSVRGLALDSAFAFYIGMGNEALGGTWFTYPLAWLLLSNSHSPADVIADIAPTPSLCFHSADDPVVPITQGRALFEAGAEPKQFVEVARRGHPIATSTQQGRTRLVEFFDECLRD